MSRTPRRSPYSPRLVSRRPAGRWSWLVACGAVALGGVGCKTITPALPGGGSGGSGGSNDGGARDIVMVDMPPVEKFMAGDSAANSDGACSAVRSGAKLVPLDIYVLMDSSKSMNDADTAGNSKWSTVKTAMSGFFNDANSAGFSVALKYFPGETADIPEACGADADCKGSGPCDQRRACVAKGTFSKTPSTLCTDATQCAANEICVPVQHCAMGPNCMARNCVADPASPMACPSDCMPFDGYCRGRDICLASDYGNPEVAFGSLPGAAPALISSLAGHSPSGYTPTGPALTGALQAARKHAMENLDHRVAVVLVTDGLPGSFIPGANGNNCNPPDVAGVATLLSGSMGLTGVPTIPTFVIGIFGPCDLQQGNTQMPREKLTSWAAAGGTTNAVIVDTSLTVAEQTQAILDALKQAQTKVITCQYEIPKNVVGGIDFEKVSVDFSSTAMTTPTSIHYVGKNENCDPNSGGWYYDKDPAVTPPTQIIACDKSCTDFKSTAGAQVDVLLGCARVN